MDKTQIYTKAVEFGLSRKQISELIGIQPASVQRYVEKQG